MDTKLSYDVAVIGGGAAGFFAAIAIAEARAGTRVVILEASPRVLTKVKVSGGGRCNVTHHLFEPKEFIKRYPRGEKELLGPFHRFGAQQTIAWFAAHGVTLKAEADGRMFPDTNSSQTIIDALQEAQRAAGVELRCRTLVQSIARTSEGFRLNLRQDDSLEARYVVLATGSMSQGLELAKSLGHELVAPVPSLFTFEIEESFLKELAGQSFAQINAQLRVGSAKKSWMQSGPALITHWGMSGPAILRLSAFAARELAEQDYKAELTVNWCGESKGDEVRSLLVQSKHDSAKKNMSNEHPFAFSKRFWEALLAYAQIPGDKVWAQLNNKELQALVEALTAMKLSVCGKGVFKEEFVTAGGIQRQDVDFRSMESRLCSGLYFAGEVLDIDGVTGGFNFQNAWTGAWLAGQHLAERLG